MKIFSFFCVYVPETLDALIIAYKLINKVGNYCITLYLFSFVQYSNKPRSRAAFINILDLRCGVNSRAVLIQGRR